MQVLVDRPQQRTTQLVALAQVSYRSCSRHGHRICAPLERLVGCIFMARTLQQIQEEIRGLSTSDKEALLRALWEDLDGPPDRDVDQAWLEEARRGDAGRDV